MNRWTSVLLHGLVGWAICGATVGTGRQLLPMDVTLIIHAVVAPVAFGLLTWRHMRRFPDSSPWGVALGMTGLVVGLDAAVVAPLFEKSYEMFRSILGTWIPFALIFAASYLVARQISSRPQGIGHAALHQEMDCSRRSET